MGSILSEKPSDVRAFLIAHLESVKGSKPKTLFTKEDLECMFDMSGCVALGPSGT